MLGRQLMATVLAIALGVVGGCSNDCSQPLSQSGCMATFEAQMGAVPVGLCAFVGSCGAYRIWSLEGGYSTQTCVYDSSGEHLVSATSCTDIKAYCDDSSFCVSAGQGIDIFKTCDVQSLPKSCSQITGE